MYTGAYKKRDRAQVDPEEEAENDKGVYEIFNRSKKTIRSPGQREAEVERKKAENKAKYRVDTGNKGNDERDDERDG